MKYPTAVISVALGKGIVRSCLAETSNGCPLRCRSTNEAIALNVSLGNDEWLSYIERLAEKNHLAYRSIVRRKGEDLLLKA